MATKKTKIDKNTHDVQNTENIDYVSSSHSTPIVYKKSSKYASRDKDQKEHSFHINMVTSVLDDYQDIMQDPKVEKGLIDTVKEYCRKSKMEKIKKQIDNLTMKLEDDASKLYKQVNESAPKCSVCLDSNILSPVELKCNHSVCQKCFLKMIKRCCSGKINIKCPECRRLTHWKIGYESHNNSDNDSD